MLNLLKTRRSVRRYKDQEISQEQIDSILNAAFMSPSSRNLRSWEFVVVTDKQLLTQLSQAKSGTAAFLKNAPLGIVVLGDSEVSDMWVEDAAIASTIIQLTAQSIGLTSCWIQIRKREYDRHRSSEQYVQSVLGIPDTKKVLTIIAIGHANEFPQPHGDDVYQAAKVHFNQYGMR